MADMQAKVIRVDAKRMTVITEEGDFLSLPVPAARPQPGDQILVQVQVQPAKRFTIPAWIRAAAAILAIGLSLALARPLVLPQAVAAVSMDLSSSVELSVDKNDKILRAKANNHQGEAVLKNLDLTGVDVYEAANRVTAAAIQMGYLDPASDSTVMVTVAPLTEAGQRAVNCDKLQQVMHDELTKQQYEGYLVVSQGESEIKTEAEKAGLTVNQYLVWRQMQQQEAPMDIQQFKGQPLDQVLSGDETSLNRMFPGRWCRVGRIQQTGGLQTGTVPGGAAGGLQNGMVGGQENAGAGQQIPGEPGAGPGGQAQVGPGGPWLMEPRMGPGMGPGTGAGMGPGMGPRMGPGMGPGQIGPGGAVPPETE